MIILKGLRDLFTVLSLLSIYLPPPYLLLSIFHPNRCPRNLDILPTSLHPSRTLVTFDFLSIAVVVDLRGNIWMF